MATSAINIKANAQEVINLKRKIDELSASLVSMQRSANPALYDKLNNELQKTTIKYNNLRSEVNQYAKEQERAAKATAQTSDSLVDLVKKGAAIGGITFGVDKIMQLGSEIISVRGEIQQLQIAFETMLGSKEKADRMMGDIKKLALSTPFTLTEVADNTKQIIAMGIASEKAVDTVRMLGDVAAGVSVPLWRVAVNYGQVSALGKLQSREIRDFALAGIPIVDELGKMLGKTSAEIYEMVEAGKIGFPQVEQAFKNMSGEGGKFYNLMEKQNASVTGQISKLQDSLQLMFNEIGQSSEGVIYTAIDGASRLVDSYQEVGVILAGLVSTYGLYKAALITTAAIQPIQIAQTYEAQAVALTKLLNGEQAYRISQMGLVQGSSDHVAAIQAEIAATAENIKIKLSEEEVNLQSLRIKRADAEQTWITAKANTEAARQELSAAIATATAEAEAALQKKMALESEKQSRAALRLVKLQEQKDASISQAIALKEKGASDTKIAAKNREIASIQSKIAVARAEEIQSGRNVAAMRAEIKSGVDITANKNVQTLTNKLNTLSERENSAATAHNGVIKQMVGSKILIKKLTTDVDTASTTANTAATTANTVATSALSAAKTKAIAIGKNLLSVIAPNPYILAAAAVVALGYGIYQLATYQTEAEKAQSRLNETTKEYESNIEGEKVKLDILFGRLKSAKEGTDKYKEAKQGILDIADSYHLSISKDIDLVKEETKYRNILNAAIIETAKAKAIESGTQKATEIYTKTWGDAISDIRERFIKTFGESQGELLLDSLKESLSEGKSITKDVQNAIDKFNETYYSSSSISGGGTYTTSFNPVQQLVTNVQLSKKTLDKEVSDLEGVFGKLNKKPTNSTTDTIKEFSEQTDDARKNVAKLKKELSDLQKGINPNQDGKQFDFSKGIEEKAKELKDAEDKLSYLTSGKSYSASGKDAKSGESAASKARKQAQELADLQIKLTNEQVKLELERQQKVLDAQKEGLEKQLDQNNLNYDKQLQQISEFEAEKLKAQQEAIQKYGKDKLPEELSTANINNQSALMRSSAFADWQRANNKAIEDNRNAERTAMNEYLSEYGTYLEKRQGLIELYNDKLVKAQKEGASDWVIKGLGEELNKSLSDLDIEASEKTSAIGKLFSDMSRRSVKDIRAIADEAERALKFITDGEWDNAKGKEFGITKETFDLWKKSPEKLESIRKGIQDINREADNAETSLNKMSNGLNKVFNSKGDTKTFQEGLNDLQQGFSEVMNAAGFLSDSLSTLGDSLDIGALKGIAEGLNEVMAVADSTMKGAQAGSVFGPVGSAVGATLGFVSSISSAFANFHDKKHEKRIQVLQGQIDELEKSYERLGKAIDKAYSYDASELINKQNDELEQQKRLIEQQIKEEEDKKKTDNNRIKQWKEQIDEINRIQEENKEKAVDAIFGEDIKSAIDEFANAYVEAWAAGEDRAQAMKDVVKNMIKGIIVEMLKSDLAPTIEKIRNKIQEFLTDGIIDATEQAQLDKIIEDATKQADSKYSWADKYLQDNKDTSSQQASSGGFETMSQDTGDALEGRFTAMQMSLISIDENVKHIAQWNQPVSDKLSLDSMSMPLISLSESSLRIERMIEENRTIAINSYYELRDINKNTNQLYQMNERLGEMNQKLDRL